MQIEVIAKPAESADVTVVFAGEGKQLLGLAAPLGKAQIGRASWRERVLS